MLLNFMRVFFSRKENYDAVLNDPDSTENQKTDAKNQFINARDEAYQGIFDEVPTLVGKSFGDINKELSDGVEQKLEDYNTAHTNFSSAQADVISTRDDLKEAQEALRTAEKNLYEHKEQIDKIQGAIEFKNKGGEMHRMLSDLQGKVKAATPSTKEAIITDITTTYNNLTAEDRAQKDANDDIISGGLPDVLNDGDSNLDSVQNTIDSELAHASKEIIRLGGVDISSTGPTGQNTDLGSIAETKKFAEDYEEGSILRTLYDRRVTEMKSRLQEFQDKKVALEKVQEIVTDLNSPDVKTSTLDGLVTKDSAGSYTINEDAPEILKPILYRYVRLQEATNPSVL